MKHLYSDGQKDSQQDGALPSSPHINAKLKQDNPPDFKVLEICELKTKFENVCSKLPFLVDVKQENDSHICHFNSCPCSNNLDIANYISVSSPRKDFSEHSIFPRHRVSESLSSFYRQASLLSIPLNQRSSGFLFGSQKSHRNTSSMDNVGDFFVQYPSVNPSQGWIFESIEASTKANALLESSLLFHLDIINGKRRQSKSASANDRLIGRQSSELNTSERKLVSCSSTSSTWLNLSSSPADSLTKGLLHCVWKSGIPYFVFSLEFDGDVYMANPQKVESDKALDYVYLFRSKNYRSHRKIASAAVGKMKVSSALVIDSNNSKFMETEFVLSGSREDYLKEMESSASIPFKSKGFTKMVTEIFRSGHKFKHKSICKFDDFLWEMSTGDLDQLDNVNHFVQDFPPNLELAAIVVKDYQCNSNKLAAAGGWGLKFLEKANVCDTTDNDEECSFSCTNYDGDTGRNCQHPTRKTNVIVPAGFHGGPIHTTAGPSSLIGRWKSGGDCDCGGWDLGCPLTVLDINSICSENLGVEGSEEDTQPICLFVEVRYTFLLWLILV